MATEGVAEGAVQGAAAGTAIMPGVGTLIGAGVGALAGFMGSRSAAKNRRTQTNRLKLRASPQHLIDVMKQLAPFYRELVAAGLGPAFLQESARQISLAGLSGTGVGEALGSISRAVPGAAAAGMTSEAAQGVVNRELASVGGMPVETSNPLADALSAGLRGYIGASEAQRARDAAIINRSNRTVMNPTSTTTPTVPYTGPFPDEEPLFPQLKPLELAPLERPGVNI